MSEKIIGPCLPPGLKISNNDSIEENVSNKETVNNIDQNEDSSDDEFGPALPPGFEDKSSPKVIGPSIPSHLKQKVEDDDNENSDDVEDDDELFGPVLPGQVDKNHMYDASQKLLKKKKESSREEWMLTPGKGVSKHLLLQTKSVTKFSQKSNKNDKDPPLTDEQKLELEAIIAKETNIAKCMNKFEKVFNSKFRELFCLIFCFVGEACSIFAGFAYYSSQEK